MSTQPDIIGIVKELGEYKLVPLEGEHPMSIPILPSTLEHFERSHKAMPNIAQALLIAVEVLEGYAKYEETEYGHKDSAAHGALSRIRSL